MKWYKIFDYEQKVVCKQKDSSGIHFNPVKDINGDYFISELEHNLSGLGVESEFIKPEIQLEE